jgi:hypothetical protein
MTTKNVCNHSEAREGHFSAVAGAEQLRNLKEQDVP